MSNIKIIKPLNNFNESNKVTSKIYVSLTGVKFYGIITLDSCLCYRKTQAGKILPVTFKYLFNKQTLNLEAESYFNDSLSKAPIRAVKRYASKLYKQAIKDDEAAVLLAIIETVKNYEVVFEDVESELLFSYFSNKYYNLEIRDSFYVQYAIIEHIPDRVLKIENNNTVIYNPTTDTYFVQLKHLL